MHVQSYVWRLEAFNIFQKEKLQASMQVQSKALMRAQGRSTAELQIRLAGNP